MSGIGCGFNRYVYIQWSIVVGSRNHTGESPVYAAWAGS